MLIEFAGNVITQPFGRLGNLLPELQVEVGHHGIDQAMQVLLGASSADVLIVHLTLEHFVARGAEPEDAVSAMQVYVDALAGFTARNHALVIANTVPPPVRRLVGNHHIAQVRLVAQLNEMLLACADRTERLSIVDLAGVLARAGHDKSISASNAAMMRMPYTSHVLPDLLREYARAIRERFLARKKVLLLDADNTLWGGVIGEDGPTGIQVDEQYPGVLYRRFQEMLLELRASGMLLALVTKNNEADVQEAFATLRMPLQWESFAAIRANWDAKSSNIESIAGELNVGVESMVFIDDNPIEIAEVNARFPALAARQFDIREAADALGWLEALPDVSTWCPSAEDLVKSDQYRQESVRRELAASAVSLDDYIASLGMVIEAGVNRRDHVRRIAQLTNKTNQFNLTTRRYSEGDVLAAMDEGQVFDFRVRDRFGDMGIIAVAVIRNAEIETFLMSCRALGRKVEYDIIKHVLSQIPEDCITAKFIRSEKNAMAEKFYDECGFHLTEAAQSVRSYMVSKPFDLDYSSRIIEVE